MAPACPVPWSAARGSPPRGTSSWTRPTITSATPTTASRPSSNRDSYNNAGAQLRATVHYSTTYVNAYWDGTQMVYGDGDGVNSSQLGLDADVTTHELTHATTQSESNLTYSGEPGGLNESLSDIFASMCESWASGTWSTAPDIFMIGEDIWTPGTPGDALRYLDDPARDGVSLDFYPNYNSSTDVHYSSGISNLAYALMAKGGKHPRGKTSNVVTAMGVEKAGRIFYKANTDFFTANTTFAMAKMYTEQAASALGYDTATQSSVTGAWMAVGVTGVVIESNLRINGVATTGLSGSSGSQRTLLLTVPASKPVSL